MTSLWIIWTVVNCCHLKQKVLSALWGAPDRHLTEFKQELKAFRVRERHSGAYKFIKHCWRIRGFNVSEELEIFQIQHVELTKLKNKNNNSLEMLKWMIFDFVYQKLSCQKCFVLCCKAPFRGLTVIWTFMCTNNCSFVYYPQCIFIVVWYWWHLRCGSKSCMKMKRRERFV